MTMHAQTKVKLVDMLRRPQISLKVSSADKPSKSFIMLPECLQLPVKLSHSQSTWTASSLFVTDALAGFIPHASMVYILLWLSGVETTQHDERGSQHSCLVIFKLTPFPETVGVLCLCP